MEKISGQASEGEVLDKLRRHIRILVDIGRLAGTHADLNRFLDQTVVQIARAVEINHVKVLCYRPRESDPLVLAGVGWKEGVIGTATLSAAYVRRLGVPLRPQNPSTSKNFEEQVEYVY